MRKNTSTPAIKMLESANIPFRVYSYDNTSSDYGEEAVDVMVARLGIDPHQVFKTLIIELSEKRTPGEPSLAVAIVPVPERLSMKKAAHAFGAKKASMARINDAEKTTGYVAGGISPFGQRHKLRTFIDNSANKWEKIYVSAGKRGCDIEISPADLMHITACKTADLTED